MDEHYDSGFDAQTRTVREDHCSKQGHGKRQGADLVPFPVGNLKLPIVRGVETRVSESYIQVPEHHVGILTPISEVLFYPQPIRDILYERFVGDENILLSPGSPFYTRSHGVYAILFSSSVGVISAIP